VTKLPVSLRIGYRDYKVDRWPSKAANAHNANGLCDPISAVIHVSEDRTGYDAIATLLHEILHAVFDMADIDPKQDDEERIVTRLASALAQVWRDNPSLRECMNGVISDFARRAEGEVVAAGIFRPLAGSHPREVPPLAAT
jgi:hypothetical protein